MSKVVIKFVDENEKFDKVKLVKPNITFNRADLMYGEKFGLLEVQNSGNIKYVSFFMKPKLCYLVVYMMDLSKQEFDGIIKFLYKTYGVTNFKVYQSLNRKNSFYEGVCYVLNLPDTVEEYYKQFKAHTRYNRRAERRKIENKFNCKFCHLDKSQLTKEFFENFLQLKRLDYETAYSDKSPQDMLSDYFNITDAYLLMINDEIVAYALYSICDKDDSYLVNLAYNHDYSKYYVGNVLYYYSIEEMIKRKIKRIYLGGVKYAYKENSKAITSNTYGGSCFYLPFVKKMFSIQKELNDDGRFIKVLYLLGRKFRLTKNDIPTENYVQYYKKINLEKKIKKIAKTTKNHKIIIYGAGKMAKDVFDNYDLSGLDIVGICDKNFQKNSGETFCGYPCLSLDDINQYINDIYIYIILRRSGEVARCLELENKSCWKNVIIKPFIS